jgi:uncharacterized membrane protein YtjA (UPF0391 family)
MQQVSFASFNIVPIRLKRQIFPADRRYFFETKIEISMERCKDSTLPKTRTLKLFRQSTCTSAPQEVKKAKMLYYTLIFLLIAIVAGILGFWAVAGVAAVIAKTLFFIFLVVFIISLLGGLTRRV